MFCIGKKRSSLMVIDSSSSFLFIKYPIEIRLFQFQGHFDKTVDPGFKTWQNLTLTMALSTLCTVESVLFLSLRLSE